ncbi:DUF1028 domain-containing protein [Mesobacillus sp. AQ2]|jgi:uncharacterized Ntn-hydrolase superfamily protein|uniref:DUF1028 domain-containing protein n=1 Tax=Bacillaceae TaxID=186817 RepID=UPI00119D781B|nr:MULTISPECIES: DUF1028 domain-containing protein [Bacillaceae]MCM3125519.1 DUF1028 domain-containing protein [Mesobacillus sp. MER 33]MCM3234437.1 DUF1028 domain-containing protein [Mesobacillus sp. MER 48]WHX41373.1 DUF1028 domain-containing protein [Mesobacillus sp. AQ2]
MTFSITARCEKTGMLGVAVSTARPAVGSLVPYVKTGIGAIATQATVNPFYGLDGIKLLAEGKLPAEVLEQLLASDPDPERRQCAIVDKYGNATGFTGKDTVPWQGHKIGFQFVVAGNMLTGPETIDAMFETYQALKNESLPERLLAALASGQEAGGDKRGRQSAALYVVDQEEYPLVDVRADEHHEPVQELIRIYKQCQEDLFPYTANLVKRREEAIE